MSRPLQPSLKYTNGRTNAPINMSFGFFITNEPHYCGKQLSNFGVIYPQINTHQQRNRVTSFAENSSSP